MPLQAKNDLPERNSIEKAIEKQNITKNNFFIEKARIEIFAGGASEHYLGTIKFLYPDTFLISIRNKTGIEGARIYFTGDTVLINDRINRKVLYGKPSMAGRKYGISPEIIPLIFGDYIFGDNSENIQSCIDGKASVNTGKHGYRISYLIDCKKAKVITASREGSNALSGAVFNYDKFIFNTDLFYPSYISVEHSDMIIKIRIDKIDINWNGNIEFVQGKNYEHIEIL
jgi:hypothetical protein